MIRSAAIDVDRLDQAPGLEVVGLFPDLSANAYGGVQASGREAWSGVVAAVGPRSTTALYYRTGQSKARAVFDALSTRRKADVVVVWHLDLLKLVPFLSHRGCRVAVFLHGIEAWRTLDAVTSRLISRVDLVLSNSDYTWSRFVECNPACGHLTHRTVHLGLGSAIDPVAPNPSTPAALMIGRLDSREDYKGHRQMIDAWPLVLERVPQARLWIVGSGDLQGRLAHLVEEQRLSEKVRLLGGVPHAEKERLLAESRCLAMPSRAEGFGLVYLEAMRMGRPCLVSTLDAGREVVLPPVAGVAVDPDSPEQLAGAVVRMLTPGNEWDGWSTRARARYDGYYTGDHFRQRLNNALLEN